MDEVEKSLAIIMSRTEKFHEATKEEKIKKGKTIPNLKIVLSLEKKGYSIVVFICWNSIDKNSN